MSYIDSNEHLPIPIKQLNTEVNTATKEQSRNLSALIKTANKAMLAKAHRDLLSSPKDESVMTNAYTKTITSFHKHNNTNNKNKHNCCITNRSHNISSIPLSAKTNTHTHTTVNNSFLNKNPKYEAMAIRDKDLQNKKQRIKGKMIKLMHNSLIINQEIANRMKLDYNYEKSLECNRNKMKSQKRAVFFVNTKADINDYNILDPQYRFEDCYYTPNEFIKKNFNKEEIKTVNSDPKYFLLDKEPFKDNETVFHLNLVDKINDEDKKRLKAKDNGKERGKSIRIGKGDFKLPNGNIDNLITTRCNTALNSKRLHLNTEAKTKNFNQQPIDYRKVISIKSAKERHSCYSKVITDSNMQKKRRIRKFHFIVKKESFQIECIKNRMQFYSQIRSRNQAKKLLDIEDDYFIRKMITILKYNYSSK